MEGIFLQQVPVLGPLVGGILLLVTVLGVIMYGWVRGEQAHPKAKPQSFKRAA